MKSEDSLATILLTSRIDSDGLDPLKASEFWKLCEQIVHPSTLLGHGEDILSRDHGLGADMASRVVALLGRATAMAFELERLDQSGIATLTPFDKRYPQRLVARLGTKAPPIVHAAGNLGLLEEPGLGVVGSRTVSREGGNTAEEAAKTATRLGLPVVSGGARGVDQLAMDAAFRAGGRVIGIPADSLVSTLRNKDIRRAIYEEATVMCTPHRPDVPFSPRIAMERNGLIYAQSLWTLVVASDEDRGGTWEGAIEALKQKYGRVAVWRGPGEARTKGDLEEHGAVPVRSIDELEELVGAPEAAAAEALPTAEQTSLFGPMMTEHGQETGLEVATRRADSDAADDDDVGGGPPSAIPDPTGHCWCGCGTAVTGRRYFASGHANRASSRVIREVYGSTEAFLLKHGYAPTAPTQHADDRD